MLEQEYLEMANQLKEKFDENESRYKMLIMENRDLKKMIYTAYGNIRMIDWLLHFEEEIGTELKITIENTRGLLSDFLDDINSPPCIHINVERPTPPTESNENAS